MLRFRIEMGKPQPLSGGVFISLLHNSCRVHIKDCLGYSYSLLLLCKWKYVVLGRSYHLPCSGVINSYKQHVIYLFLLLQWYDCTH